MPFLGVNRTAELAGWGTGPLQVAFNNTSTLASTIYQEPEFSLLFNNSVSSVSASTGSIDLTGYSSLAGFNNYNLTTFATVYLPWSSMSGYDELTVYNQLSDSTGYTDYNNINIKYDNTVSKIKIETFQGITYTLPNAPSTYSDRWLVIVVCCATNYTQYTSWSGSTATGTNYSYARIAVIDVLTGDLVGKYDQTVFPRTVVDITALANPLPVHTTDTSKFDTGVFCGYSVGGRVAGLWSAMGTMFDPLNVTNKSWLTPRPSAQIGNAVAWTNFNFTNFEDYGVNNTGIFANDLDLYTSGNGYIASVSTTDWSTMYSSTIIPRSAA